MKTILITGSTQGLGLQIVKQLASNSDIRIIMAVRNIVKGNEIAKSLGDNVSVTELDLASLTNVGKFIKSWNKKIDGSLPPI